MKAAVRSKYGTAEVLSIKEIETPTPTHNEVLIKVYATTCRTIRVFTTLSDKFQSVGVKPRWDKSLYLDPVIKIVLQ